MKISREIQADRLDEIAVELEQAIRHARVAAEQFRADQVPRGAAHALAVSGHLLATQDLMEEIARDHRLATQEPPR